MCRTIPFAVYLASTPTYAGCEITQEMGDLVTPAMAAGPKHDVWTMEELLSYRVPPDFRNRLDQQAINDTS